MLLTNPQIRKVGQMVNNDLRQLQAVFHSQIPFVGSLDLAAYAKERQVVPNAKCSLADICAAVLKKCLRKNMSERTSTAWEHANLSLEQLHYAACDAYVSLILHHELSKFSVLRPLPQELVPSTSVLLYNADNTAIIAKGQLQAEPSQRVFDDIKLTVRHTLVKITEVIVPATLISSHNKRALKSFGAPPFSAVCLHSHLRVFDAFTFHAPKSNPPLISVNDVMMVDSQPSSLDPADTQANDDTLPVDGIGTTLHAAMNVDGSVLDEVSGQESNQGSQEVDLQSQCYG